MNLTEASDIVLTLDAGGTNFVFAAMQAGREVSESIHLPAETVDLSRCLELIVSGFEQLREGVGGEIAAISFAFPGPADYRSGIIGDLTNLPAFRGGVALGPMLRAHFGVPVHINNDGNLFAYGEAVTGLLPLINDELERHGSVRRYHSLFGVTLGTGFGGGWVFNGQMYIGDTASGAEVNLLAHPEFPDYFVESSLSIGGLCDRYAALAGEGTSSSLTPRDIAEIARGRKPGDQAAAIRSYRDFGRILGFALASVATITDAPVVIGGGLAASYDLFIGDAMDYLNGSIKDRSGRSMDRLESKVLNWEDEYQRSEFLHDQFIPLVVPGSGIRVSYSPHRKLILGRSVLGTSRAVSLGAYAYALHMKDKV